MQRLFLTAFIAMLSCAQSLQAAGAFLIFTPSSTSLIGNSGGPVVTQTVLLQNSGSGVTDWAIGVDPTAPWLTASPARGQALQPGSSVTITVSANPLTLKLNSVPGYQANMTAQGTGTSATLGVTFKVSGTAISVIPNPISLTVLTGTQQTFQNVAQINGVANVSITATSSGWLSNDTPSQTPNPFSIFINAQGLAASQTPYQGSLLIQCVNGPPCIPQTVPVILTVYSPVTVTCTPTTGPAQVGVAYSTTCNASGGSASYIWSIGPGTLPSGVSLSSTTGNSIKISGTPTNTGPYAYTIRVTENGIRQQFAQQAFSGTIVPGAPPSLTASPTILPFGTYIVGGAVPPLQSIGVTSSNPALGVGFTSTFGSDCAWLTVQPTAGTTPNTLSASVNTANATPGNHSCVITFSASGVSPNPTVTATLTVNTPTPTLTVAPSPLSFGTFSQGDPVPASQNIALSSTNPSTGLAFTSSLGTDCAWLTLSPASGSTPVILPVSVNTANATPGNHTCLITFNANGVSPSPTVTATLTVGSGNRPVISAVVNAAGFNAGPLATGSWVSVFGTNLAPSGDSRQWNTSTEIVNGVFPTALDGTSVTVNGKAAPIAYISPTQVNIQMPDDSAIGPVQVVLSTTAGGASVPATVNYARFGPGFFTATSPYLVAQHADGSYIGGYPGATPAAPGEVIVLWGTGFGPASPPVPTGQVFTGANVLASQVTVMIAGQIATVDFAGVVGDGLVQINAHVPASINNGDATVFAIIGGVSTQSTDNFIAVHN